MRYMRRAIAEYSMSAGEALRTMLAYSAASPALVMSPFIFAPMRLPRRSIIVKMAGRPRLHQPATAALQRRRRPAADDWRPRCIGTLYQLKQTRLLLFERKELIYFYCLLRFSCIDAFFSIAIRGLQ